MIEKNVHMLKEVLDFTYLLQSGINEGKRISLSADITVRKIILVGMGASGLVGDYLKSYFSAKFPYLDFFIYKSHLFPKEKGFYIILKNSQKTAIKFINSYPYHQRWLKC